MEELKPIPMPEGLTYWEVDSVIECLPFSTERGQRSAIERELMEHAPRAYHGDGVPLGRVWSSLTAHTQHAIADAWALEMEAYRV